MLFSGYYGEQSCTAGRPAFITGQHPVRTGLTRVGVPGAPPGLQPEDPTLTASFAARQTDASKTAAGQLHDRPDYGIALPAVT